MTTPLTVAVVLSPRPWSIQLHSFVADHVPDIDIVVVRDRRAAFDAKPHVLVIDDASPWLTQSFVSDAELAGIRLVGVYDRADSNGRDRLVGLGLTHLIEEAMPPEDVVFLLDRLRPSTEFRAIGETRDRSASTSSERGSVIAVGGPSGSGARELAVALAATWGPARSTLLVDCNETTPGVARRLGLTPYPHILTAIDRCHSEGLSGIDAALADQPHRLPFDAIAGLATPRDWDRLIAHDLTRHARHLPRRLGASRRHDESTRRGPSALGRPVRSQPCGPAQRRRRRRLCGANTTRNVAIPRLAERHRLRCVRRR